MRDIFKKIGKSKASMGGNYIRDGEYLFAVRNVIVKDSDAGSGIYFIVELDVIEAKNDPNAIDNGTPVIANPVGSQASFVTELTANKSGPGNAKAFVLGLLGYEEAEVTDDDVASTLEDFTSKEQPARGMLVRDTTFRKPVKTGKNAGNPFTAHRWTNVPQSPEEIASRRAAMDKADKAASA